MTERLARHAALHPKRMVAIWAAIFVLSIAAIAGLLPSAITTDAHVTNNPESEQGYAALGRQMRARQIEREYIALVRGRPPSRRGTIDAPIGRDRNDVGRMAVGGRSERPAVTHFELAEPLGNASLLRLKLETGRTHQIRVHLAAIGHPVLGDPLYGVPGGQIGLRRQFLHAARLAFEHPGDGRRVELESALPDDLAEALGRARDAA